LGVCRANALCVAACAWRAEVEDTETSQQPLQAEPMQPLPTSQASVARDVPYAKPSTDKPDHENEANSRYTHSLTVSKNARASCCQVRAWCSPVKRPRSCQKQTGGTEEASIRVCTPHATRPYAAFALSRVTHSKAIGRSPTQFCAGQQSVLQAVPSTCGHVFGLPRCAPRKSRPRRSSSLSCAPPLSAAAGRYQGVAAAAAAVAERSLRRVQQARQTDGWGEPWRGLRHGRHGCWHAAAQAASR
jgi:hypothetical protein